MALCASLVPAQCINNFKCQLLGWDALSCPVSYRQDYPLLPPYLAPEGHKVCNRWVSLGNSSYQSIPSCFGNSVG